ncbi:TolC family protein [Polymorphobacter sp. PAMC 29334]|uniref:TolC family protein n=1 Tax=Polymorphobacter sp. PAMC 29334 TaxID=2862331 RepID=UPI001C77CD7F|nr:TolC family protein [Polymorphobacter sp. PAMC 29334]QYE34587.1 TolC family protein [Polymorphobacter sp. PAMC 29334]
MIRRALLLGTILVASPTAAETLREAVLAARSTNPTFAAAQARQQALRETVEQARAGGRLTAAADVSAGYDRLGYSSGASSTVAAALPIWTGNRVPSAVRAAKADVAAGDQNVRDSEAALLTVVVAAYAELLYDQQAVAIAEADIALLQQQVAEAQARFRLGTSTRTDVAQLDAQHASAVASLADADATLITTAARYRATVGHDPGKLALPDRALLALPGTLDQARSRAVADNPLLQASLRSADASAARVDVARANRAPSVALGAQYGYAGSFADGGTHGYPLATAVTIGLHVPLLTGGLVASQVRQASAAHRADLFDTDAQQRETLRGVDAAWAALAGARARIRADAGRVEAADVALKGVRAEYAFGLRTTLDILVADESLRAAQLALAGDHSRALEAEAALLRATGRLDVSLFLAPI